jgi:TP901 family phage tail tape measure protein
MGRRTLAANIAVEGEKKYRESISNINKDLSQLQAELKKSSSEFANNSDSVEALTAKDKLLNDQVDKQKDKITALKGALASASDVYGESDDRTREWKLSLTKAETELNGLNKKVLDNREALEKANSSTHEMTDSTNKMGDAAEKTGNKTLTMADVIKANLISSAIINGVKALANAFYDLAKSSLESADLIASLAVQTGFTTTELQQLQYVGTALDVDLETITGTLSKLTKSMNTASEAGGSISDSYTKIAPDAKKVEIATLKLAAAQAKLTELQNSGKASASQLANAQANVLTAQENLRKVSTSQVIVKAGKEATGAALAFEKLGVKITNADGTLRDSKTVMFEAIDALGKMKNETERDAISLQIFGKSAMELNPLIKAGSTELERLTQAALDNGAVMSESTIEGLDNFNDSMDLLGLSIKATTGDIIADLMPTFQGIIDWIQDHREEIKEFAEKIIGSIGKALQDVLQWVEDHPEDIDKFINNMKDAIDGVVGAVEGLIGFAGDVKSFWDGLSGWGQMAVGMGVLAVGIWGVAMAVAGLQSAWSLGLAMVAIVGGIALMKASADKIMAEFGLSAGKSTNVPSYVAPTTSGSTYDSPYWHAEGGVFTTPTIFSTPAGYQGVGDVPEVILPLSKLPSMVGQMIDYDLMADAMIRAQRRVPAVAIIPRSDFSNAFSRELVKGT